MTTQTGEFIKSLIIDKIDEGMGPPNAPSTIAKKGFDHPLIQFGDMRANIQVIEEEVPNGLKIRVGWYNEEDAKKALINNYGVPGKIPARPFVTNAIDENLDAIAEMAANELLDKILGGTK
jgi:hypothetical protein